MVHRLHWRYCFEVPVKPYSPSHATWVLRCSPGNISARFRNIATIPPGSIRICKCILIRMYLYNSIYTRSHGHFPTSYIHIYYHLSLVDLSRHGSHLLRSWVPEVPNQLSPNARRRIVLMTAGWNPFLPISLHHNGWFMMINNDA